jgi:hypothetical protein
VAFFPYRRSRRCSARGQPASREHGIEAFTNYPSDSLSTKPPAHRPRVAQSLCGQVENSGMVDRRLSRHGDGRTMRLTRPLVWDLKDPSDARPLRLLAVSSCQRLLESVGSENRIAVTECPTCRAQRASYRGRGDIRALPLALELGPYDGQLKVTKATVLLA